MERGAQTGAGSPEAAGEEDQQLFVSQLVFQGYSGTDVVLQMSLFIVV